METSAEVHPFGIDPLALSRLFMHEDLAKSGLSASDFPIPPEPLQAISGRACYKNLYFVEQYWINQRWGVTANS